MTWTEDRIEILKHDWQDGFSASQIAQQLGGVTRNAVIGKVHRLGLAGRATTSRYLQSTRSRSPSLTARAAGRSRGRGRTFRIRHSPAPIKSLRPSIVPELGTPPPLPVTVRSLTCSTCRWPEGDPKAADFHFCGRTKERPDIPYCDHHDAIAHR